MDSLYEKCQKQEMKNTQGTGSEKLTSCVQLKNSQSGQIMETTL